MQIKSRQARVGDFSTSEATGHVLQPWGKHRARRAIDPSNRLALVFERPVVGEASAAWGTALDRSMASPGLVGELRTRAASDGISEPEIDAIVAETCVVALPWQETYASSAIELRSRPG